MAERGPAAAVYAPYRAACAEAVAQPPEAWAFKRDPRYTPILEHVTPEQGRAYLERVRAAFPERWDAVRARLPRWAAEADALGQPERARYPDDGLECSPANLRYLCHALLLLRHAEATGLRPLRVVELGGGYGGLAHYVHRLAPLFGQPAVEYDLVDVPEASALQRAYAAALGLDVLAWDGLDPDQLEAVVALAGGALFVSAYAFSEFDAEARAWYAPLARACARGFVVWNFPTPLYAFVDAPLTVRPEEPCTGPGNAEVCW